jgi:hypothetical protein
MVFISERRSLLMFGIIPDKIRIVLLTEVID